MKKFFIAIFAIMLVAIPVVSFAGDFAANEQVYVRAEEIIDGSFFAAGESITIEGEIEGDVYATGGVIRINGKVDGDVIAAGGIIDISGPVQGNVRIAGGEVNISGVIGKNLTVAAGNLDITEDAAIGWEAMVAAGAVDFRGSVQKDMRVAAGGLFLNGEVGDDVFATVGEDGGFVVQPKAMIGGDLVYSAPKQAEFLSGATINGENKFTPVKNTEFNRDQLKSMLRGLFLGIALIKLLTLWILGLLFVWMVPKYVDQVSNQIRKELWPSIGWGVLAMVVAPIVLGLLAITGILLPLALFGFVLYFIYLTVGFIHGATCFGEIVLKKLMKRHLRGVSLYWSVILGILLMTIIGIIPVIGWIIVCLTTAAGLGAMIDTAKKEMKRYR